MTKLKVCIISEEAYPYFKGGDGGGAELQMTLLAKNLVKKGHEIFFITFGKADKYYEEIEMINVFNPYYNKKKGYTHFFPDKLLKYWNLLNKINADVYIQRAGPLTTPIIGLTRKKFIFSVSNENTVSSHLNIKGIKDLMHVFRIIGIKLSDCVCCQTENQKKLLEKNSSKKGRVIKNICIPSRHTSEKKIKQVLWVGRIIRSKSPEKYLELAQKLPDYNFKMIGGLSFGDESYFEEIKEKAENLKNLEFSGSVPREEIDKYYSESYLLVNTSSSEGFPNTFLESWANKIPVVSLNFDPDNIISRFNLGIFSKNFNELVENTQKLMEDDLLREDLGNNGFNYVNSEHSADNIVSQYENLFQTLVMKSK